MGNIISHFKGNINNSQVALKHVFSSFYNYPVQKESLMYAEL